MVRRGGSPGPFGLVTPPTPQEHDVGLVGRLADRPGSGGQQTGDGAAEEVGPDSGVGLGQLGLEVGDGR